MKNKQGGFLPIIAIAIIAALAVGGGAYAVKKNKERKMHEGDNIETRADARADINANENANLGANGYMKGSLKSLLGMGKDTECTIENNAENYSSKGTVYVSNRNEMRGDFLAIVQGRNIDSHMIMKDEVMYSWSGSQGSKMSIKGMQMLKEGEISDSYKNMGQGSMDLSNQVNYSCKNWSYDSSKFTLPTEVKFTDVNELMKKMNINPNVNINSNIKTNTDIKIPTIR